MKVKDLIAEVVSLPVEERTVLVDSLLRSLNAPEEGIEREWIAEAQRRLEEVRSGAAAVRRPHDGGVLSLSKGAAGTIPGDEVFAAIGKRFAG